jgi:hypothetical protein
MFGGGKVIILFFAGRFAKLSEEIKHGIGILLLALMDFSSGRVTECGEGDFASAIFY